VKLIRAYHRWVTGILFAVALALYVGGFSSGAAGMAFAGFIVETIAWISIAFHPKERTGEVSK
jgi:hypothetical protein